jgi:ribosomal protein S18 acetylase RimI-like enzyme
MKIRRADKQDVDALAALNAHVQSIHAAAVPSLFRNEPPALEVAEAFRGWLEDPAAFVLIAQEGLPCGYIYAQFLERPESWIRPAFRVCNISHIAVRPESRRKGVARQLIAAVEEEAARRGVTRIELDVWSFNREARETFLRIGFEVFNERMELKRSGSPSEARAMAATTAGL